mmetsp:Transcript_1106/g.1860  ORF Transcript_1106/g.1860 Transcript_1106/m.1860 type:complete len:262 (+) Transcript_1106:24-809(+)
MMVQTTALEVFKTFFGLSTYRGYDFLCPFSLSLLCAVQCRWRGEPESRSQLRPPIQRTRQTADITLHLLTGIDMHHGLLFEEHHNLSSDNSKGETICDVQTRAEILVDVGKNAPINFTIHTRGNSSHDFHEHSLTANRCGKPCCESSKPIMVLLQCHACVTIAFDAKQFRDLRPASFKQLKKCCIFHLLQFHNTNITKSTHTTRRSFVGEKHFQAQRCLSEFHFARTEIDDRPSRRIYGPRFELGDGMTVGTTRRGRSGSP